MIRRSSSRLTVLAACCASALLLAACGKSTDPATTLVEARQLIDSGESGEARIRLKQMLAKHSDVVEARVLLARIALDSGDARTADIELSALKPEQLTTADAQSARLWTDASLGKFDSVLAVLAQTNSISDAERARLRAVALRGTGSGAEALTELRSAMAAHPDDVHLRVELAATLASIGNLEQAQRELDAYLEQHPTQSDALLARGELRLRNGQAKNAIQDIEAALKHAQPTWPLAKRFSAQLLLGDAALAAGEMPRAKEQLALLEKQFAGSPGIQLLAARVALLEGRTGDAADALQRLSEAMPGNPRIQYLLIDALLRGGNKARAMALLEARVKTDPTDATAKRLLANLLMQQNRPDRVIQLLGDLDDQPSADQGVQDNLLATARVAQARAGEAIPKLQAAVSQQPNSAQARLELAGAYLQNGQAARALTELNEIRETPKPAAAVALEVSTQFALGNEREVNRVVASLASSDVETLLAAADATQHSGRQDLARTLVDRALTKEPNHPGSLLRLANLNFVEQRFDEAKATLEKLLAMDKNNLAVRVALARVAEAQGQVPAARKALQEALRQQPAALEPALMLASLELRASDATAAIQVMNAAVEAASKDGVAANAAGTLLLQGRHADEARTMFALAVEQKSDNPTYWFNLGRAQALAGDRPAALNSMSRATTLRPEWIQASAAAARLAAETQNPARAREIAQALAARLPNEAKAWLLVGQTAGLQKEWGEASAAFGRSYALVPSATAALGEYQSRAAGGLARPDQPLVAWLNREPADLTSRRLLADYYQRIGDVKAAVGQFEAIIERAPNDVASLNNLAWSLTSSDPAKAEALARRATAIEPNNAALADTLGRVLLTNGKYEEAVSVLEPAAKTLANDMSVRYRYALALARSGNKDAARHELQGVLASGASFDGVNDARALSQELGS